MVSFPVFISYSDIKSQCPCTNNSFGTSNKIIMLVLVAISGRLAKVRLIQIYCSTKEITIAIHHCSCLWYQQDIGLVGSIEQGKLAWPYVK